MSDGTVTVVLLVETIVLDEGTLALAFTEWDRRFREEPERFQSEAVRLLKSDPKTYGEACAPYLMELVREVVHSLPRAEGFITAGVAPVAEPATEAAR